MRGLWLAPVLVLGLACAPHKDGLSKVVGPNPVSDLHGVYDAVTGDDDEWSEADKEELTTAILDRGLDAATARCLVDGFSEALSLEEFANSTGYEPEITTVMHGCGMRAPADDR